MNAALEAVLRRVAPDPRLRAVRPLEGGISARVLALDVELSTGAERWVLRTPPADEELDGVTEFALLCALHRDGFPVPEPLALVPADADAGIDRPSTLVRFVEHDRGAPVPRGGLEEMASALAALHERGPVPDPALPPWSPLPLPDALPGPDPARTARLLDAARATPPPPAPARCLCHRDLWPGNLLWRGDRLVGWLDWEEARLADPLEDLAIARLELQWLLDRPRVERFTAAFERARGAPVDAAALAAWELRVALVRAGWLERWPMERAVLDFMRTVAVAVAERAAERLGVLDA